MFRAYVLSTCVLMVAAWDNVVRDEPNGVNLRNFPYPYPVPNATYPSDWPTFGRCTGCYVNENPSTCTTRCRSATNRSDPTCCYFAGKPYINQWPNNNLSYPNFPGYGFFSWSAWATSHATGSNGGNLWALKWGELPTGYSYTPEIALTVSVRDTIQVYLEEGYTFYQFVRDPQDYNTCNFTGTANTKQFTSSSRDFIPIRQRTHITQNLTLSCKEDWKCYGTDLTVRSTESNGDVQALNPEGIYGNSTCITDPNMTICKKVYYSFNLTFTAQDKGKILYFADSTRCSSGMRVKIEVVDKVIHWLGPVTEHPERFPKDGYLQKALTEGLTLGPTDEAWVVVRTPNQALYRVFDKSQWSDSCVALANQITPATVAVQMDVPAERFLYYPSGSSPRHLWKIKASKHFTADGEEMFLGDYNPFSSCAGYNNASLLPCTSSAGWCANGPTGFGERFIVRRALADVTTTQAAATTSAGSAAAAAQTTSAQPSNTTAAAPVPVPNSSSSVTVRTLFMASALLAALSCVMIG